MDAQPAFLVTSDSGGKGTAMIERIFWATNFAVMAAMLIVAGGVIAYIVGALG